MTYIEKLARFREKMTREGLDALILLHTDPHQSEYLADYWQVMPWLTGFTGSAGTVVISRDQAGVWTDSRYFIQAAEELKGSGFELMKLQIPHTPEYINWLLDNCPEGGKIGVDASLLSMGRKEAFEKKLGKKSLSFVDAGKLVSEVWTDRPQLSKGRIEVHDLAYTGKSRADKLEQIRSKMAEGGVDLHLMTVLDDIAWTFNLRGNDVGYNPVFYSYALVKTEEVFLFVDEEKLDAELQKILASDGIKLRPYASIFDDIAQLSAQSKLSYDPSKISWKLFQSIPSALTVKKSASYASRLKGVKNETEISHIREVMVKDGVALFRFFEWLKEKAANGGISEYEAGEQLEVFRGEQANYVGPSFNPIVGYKGNGAIVHYRADENKCSLILDDGILLVDSGGQYLDGTTDITRTIALGTPTEEEKRDFTLVLKGHIQLDLAVFPEGTKGFQLESFARMPLWKQMLNYGHGTGHGVGFFLNVHEGPQSLGSGASGGAAIPLQVGMLTSNEPGLYHEGRYGIRIENLVLCVEKGESENYGKFLGFESVSLCPIDLQLVDKKLLTEEEVQWLNDYHKEVEAKLGPVLHEVEREVLKRQCREIT